jgi:hypothetical protein
MQMRGIQKQNSVTTTPFTGAFEEDKTRREFISLISINLVKFSFQNECYEILNRCNRIHWKTALTSLIGQGHHVVCCTRDKTGFIP